MNDRRSGWRARNAGRARRRGSLLHSPFAVISARAALLSVVACTRPGGPSRLVRAVRGLALSALSFGIVTSLARRIPRTTRGVLLVAESLAPSRGLAALRVVVFSPFARVIASLLAVSARVGLRLVRV